MLNDGTSEYHTNLTTPLSQFFASEKPLSKFSFFCQWWHTWECCHRSFIQCIATIENINTIRSSQWHSDRCNSFHLLEGLLVNSWSWHHLWIISKHLVKRLLSLSVYWFSFHRILFFGSCCLIGHNTDFSCWLSFWCQDPCGGTDLPHRE